jgi:16S rRNA (adenine1518-N6/adenine1519-N6)-dimethyltransferase
MSDQSIIDRLPTNRRGWASLLSRLGIRPSKGLGQHFLYERGIVQRMVKQAEVGPTDAVLEVGPGLGILTSELLLRAGEVVAIERDRQLISYLEQTFGDQPNFRLVPGDALTFRAADLFPPDREFALVANLPYSAGSAIVRHYLEQPRRPTRLTVMLQLEVAERMVAQPPEMSVLGVATQFYTSARIAFEVPPPVFIPPPTVESAVAILDVKPTLPLPDDQHLAFFRIVNAGFRQKRKQVANSLAAELDMSKPAVTDWLDGAGIDPMRRAQTLTVEEWVRLTEQAPAIIDGWPK